jgi:hypothetical protein
MKKTIFIFGNGYVSKFLSEELVKLGWFVYLTSRNVTHEVQTERPNVKIINFFDPNLPKIVKSANAILSTVPTGDKIIDPVLNNYFKIISRKEFEWVGYLSSTGVYGNHDGRWVNEETQCEPSNSKSKVRLLAEKKWLELYLKYKIPVHIFRLSGIYGPGRSCLEEIEKGKDFTIIKKDQYFSRIHVLDICRAIIASITAPTPGAIYNVSDEEPTAINVVQQFGAKILNNGPLKELSIEDANLSKEFAMFFNDNKKVSSNKIVQNLTIQWRYPNYRIGLLQGCLPYLDRIVK